MKLNQVELKSVCDEIAESVFSQHEIAEVISIQKFSETLFSLAVEQEDFVIGQGRDPNLILRAVKYLRDAHLMPKSNEDWFYYSLLTLVELACPNSALTDDMNEFLNDVEEGIENIRLST